MTQRVSELTIDGEIYSSISNFGITPYGHSIVGNLWLDVDNIDGCKPFSTEFNGDYDLDEDPTPIVIVRRGECSFVTKARNIEHAGGRLAIIADNTVENVDNVVMVDDGNGNGIRIPSILIGKSDGNTLIDYLI